MLLHDRIYTDHPEIEAIVTAQAPNATAFSICQQKFDTRTIPESYILLRDIPKLPFGPQFTDEKRIAGAVGKNTPVLLLENDAIVTVGSTLLEAYDRLEVAEFSARSLIDAAMLGGLVAIGEQEIKELEKHFFK